MHGTVMRCNSQSIRFTNEFAAFRDIHETAACACFRSEKILPVLAEVLHEQLKCGEIIFTGIRVRACSFHAPPFIRSFPQRCSTVGAAACPALLGLSHNYHFASAS